MSTTRNLLTVMAIGTVKATIPSLAATSVYDIGYSAGRYAGGKECDYSMDLMIKGIIFAGAMTFFVPFSIAREWRNNSAPAYQDIETPRPMNN